MAKAKKAARPSRSAAGTKGGDAKGKDLSQTAGDVERAGETQPGLTPEQQDMEHKRAERGSQIRGTGDKPAPVHGATHHVESSTAAVDRTVPLEGDEVTIEQRPRTITVRAMKMGYYNDKRRRTGDVFRIRAPFTVDAPDEIVDGKRVKKTQTIDEFSKLWMERVDGKTPRRITTGKEALRQQHDAELAARRQPGIQTSRDDGELPTGTASPID